MYHVNVIDILTDTVVIQHNTRSEQEAEDWRDYEEVLHTEASGFKVTLCGNSN